MTVASPMPVLPLSSFYNEKNQLVWPDNAPTAGELKEKRTIFERASDVVLAETKKHGVASMATVMDAHQKLLDYGRPGLQHVRPRDPCRPRHVPHVPALAVRIFGAGGKPARTARRRHGPAPGVA